MGKSPDNYPDFKTWEYIESINKMADEYKRARNLFEILDQDDFTNFIKGK